MSGWEGIVEARGGRGDLGCGKEARKEGAWWGCGWVDGWLGGRCSRGTGRRVDGWIVGCVAAVACAALRSTRAYCAC